MALAFAAGIATAAVIVLLVRLEITQRVPSPSDCADLWNRPTNAEAQRDVETYGKVVVSGWDTKAGPHCSAMFFDRPGAPWQTYVLWLADPDGTSLAYHRDIGGESFGSPAWYFDLTGPTSPNASVGHRGRVVLT